MNNDDNGRTPYTVFGNRIRRNERKRQREKKKEEQIRKYIAAKKAPKFPNKQQVEFSFHMSNRFTFFVSSFLFLFCFD